MNRLPETEVPPAPVPFSGKDAAPNNEPPLRVAFLLPGLGRVQRGAETAFLEVARALQIFHNARVDLFGTGPEAPEGVRMHQVRCIPREKFERWPRMPGLRTEYRYEELSFVMNLAWSGLYKPRNYDVAVSCAYPYVNWYLQRAGGRERPAQVFVTQNGDWMCQAQNREYRFFRCEGLVCINPAYYERHRERYRSVLIPNGVDPDVFRPATAIDKEDFSLTIPPGRPVVVMASALIPSKGVAGAVHAVSRLPDVHLVVAGDGPERAAVAALADKLLSGRHTLLGSVPRQHMAALFRRGDAFLHMSQEEPFGIVYLEAASSGLPCVVHDGEVPHWILGDTAFYANASDPDAMAGALREALSPEIGPARARAGRERVVADWSWKAQAARYYDFFKSVAADHAARRTDRVPTEVGA